MIFVTASIAKSGCRLNHSRGSGSSRSFLSYVFFFPWSAPSPFPKSDFSSAETGLTHAGSISPPQQIRARENCVEGKFCDSPHRNRLLLRAKCSQSDRGLINQPHLRDTLAHPFGVTATPPNGAGEKMARVRQHVQSGRFSRVRSLDALGWARFDLLCGSSASSLQG